MENVYMSLLETMCKVGKVTAFEFFNDEFVQVKLESDGNEYEISIVRKGKIQEEKNDAI